MMQQAYPMMQANPYIRQPYNGAYNNMQRPMDPYQQQQQLYSNQAAYQAPTYNQAGYYQPQPQPQPQQQQYPMANSMYGRVAQGYEAPNFEANRGRGGAFAGRAGRGGFRGGRGGVNGRKKKPFVGGTLETQKEWERQTACCFFLQDKCKFGDTCRFLHRRDASLSCQFGENCHVHGTKAAEESKQQQQQAADASPQPAQENSANAVQESTAEAKNSEHASA